MFQESTFQLLQKSINHIQNLSMQYITDYSQDISVIDSGIRQAMNEPDQLYNDLRSILEALSFGTILSFQDSLKLRYVFFRGKGQRDVYTIGPFRSMVYEQNELQQLCKANHLTSGEGKELAILLSQVPSNLSRIHVIPIAKELLLSFYGLQEPEIQELDQKPSSLSFTLSQENFEKRAKELEIRYQHEYALETFITQGDFQNALKEADYFTHLSSERLGMDANVSFRSLMYAANTGFRFAAGRAGVHPVFLDEISRRYAQKLSATFTTTALKGVYYEMLKEYCSLSASYGAKECSPDIQRVIQHIRFNLGEDLNSESLARIVGFSPSHLARKFKQEMGIAISDFILQERMATAQQLLMMTDLPIRDIGARVGIADWNYFAKLFKKTTGKTPSEYRKHAEGHL